MKPTQTITGPMLYDAAQFLKMARQTTMEVAKDATILCLVIGLLAGLAWLAGA